MGPQGVLTGAGYTGGESPRVLAGGGGSQSCHAGKAALGTRHRAPSPARVGSHTKSLSGHVLPAQPQTQVIQAEPVGPTLGPIGHWRCDPKPPAEVGHG